MEVIWAALALLVVLSVAIGLTFMLALVLRFLGKLIDTFDERRE